MGLLLVEASLSSSPYVFARKDAREFILRTAEAVLVDCFFNIASRNSSAVCGGADTGVTGALPDAFCKASASLVVERAVSSVAPRRILATRLCTVGATEAAFFVLGDTDGLEDSAAGLLESQETA